MKCLGAVFLTCLAILPPAVAEVLLGPPSSKLAPLSTAAQLVAQLSDESFQRREVATAKLWQLGKTALEELQAAAGGSDPEAAYRAKELLHKIELHITPATDALIITLVERYQKASPAEKIPLLKAMRQKHAYCQILTLYAAETDPKTRSDLQTIVSGIAIFAARERLVEGDDAGARELLELAPADAKSLMSLAAYHRANGTLEQELQHAKTSKANGAPAWQLALQRAAGRLSEAQATATDAGDPLLAATMAMLAGDPLPWLEQHTANRHASRDADLYSPLAIKRWQEHALGKNDLEPCLKRLNSRNPTLRAFASNALFLLGEPTAAEASYTKSSPLDAFIYFEALERIPEALAAIGLDPDNPDFTAWVHTRFDSLLKEPDAGDTAPTSELIALASFLENRGLSEELAKAFDAPLARLAKQDPDVFTRFLASLFGNRFVRSGIPGPLLGAGSTWAGDDAERWEQLVLAAFGDNEETLACWKWFAELQPDASRKQRLAAMLAIAGYGADPDHLRDSWLALAWAAITKADADPQARLLKQLASLVGATADAATHLKIRDLQPPAAPVTEWDRVALLQLLQFSAAGRWEEASQFILQLLASKTDPSANARPDLHAYAASCLRRAGHPNAASAHDVWVEKLALGDAASDVYIGHGYAFGGDYERCSLWWERAAREASPESEDYSDILLALSTDQLKRGLWSQAAATSEALAQIYSGSNSSPLVFLRLRLQADQAHALSLLATARASAISLLEKCHALMPCDGSLADSFFPALRQAGLIQQHDAWFELTWKPLQAVIQHYPLSHNTRNTAAWLAARALRHLDEAEAHLHQALASHPNQAAYLDTMAELQFARCNRQQAIEWSDKSINAMPADEDVRRQNERFIHDPLPE
ncbi:MAG: hypothetical protein DVB26_02070 [Verrucomicrobia bacterium]|nr:MAG: hypothetical protein DVB26_02070 [Verrucomicrobiota bacterium]